MEAMEPWSVDIDPWVGGGREEGGIQGRVARWRAFGARGVAMGKIKDWMVAHDVEAADLPFAFLVHEAISVTFAAATLGACYYMGPTRLVARAGERAAASASASASASAGAGFGRAVSGVGGGAAGTRLKAQAEALAKVVAKVPGLKNVQSGRLGAALVESVVIRGAAKPVTAPGKLGLTLAVVSGRIRRRKQGGRASDAR